MYVLKTILLAIHIAAAAMIFAAPMGTIGSLKRALADGSPGVLRSAAKDASVRAMLAQAGSVLTLLTGLGLIFMLGGFGAVSPRIHAAFGLLILALGFSLGFMKPTGKKLGMAAQATPPEKEAIQGCLGRLRVGNGVLHLVWLTILILMIYK